MTIEVGSKVAQVQSAPIEGVVTDIQYSKASKSLEYLVGYTGADGEAHQRWFAEADLETL